MKYIQAMIVALVAVIFIPVGWVIALPIISTKAGYKLCADMIDELSDTLRETNK